jgi:hypothetical protein
MIDFIITTAHWRRRRFILKEDSRIMEISVWIEGIAKARLFRRVPRSIT